MKVSDALYPFLGNFIGRAFVRPRGGRATANRDPGDVSQVVGRWTMDPAAVDAAVEEARRALPAWRSLPFEKRLPCVRRYQALLRKNKDALSLCISRETGKPLDESAAEVQTMADKVDVTLSDGLPLIADRVFPLSPQSSGAIRYRPRGVAAVIGPFNVPGHLPNGQIVPALLTGNTVVFKPSELTPFTGQIMAQCFRDAGFPRGVFNLAQGDGAAGARLARHPGVDAVFFTGSAAVGRRIQDLCRDQPGKLVALEMGGKNAALVLADAPLEPAVKEVVHGAFSTTGQRCSSTSRVFLHRSRAAAFLRLFLKEVDKLRVGYFTEKPFMGPLVRRRAVETFLRAQKTAWRLGFETLREGKTLALARPGHYVSPSVHLWDGPWKPPASPAYWDEELFAPDVAIYLMSSPDDMVAANNASRFGLVASVFTRSEKRFRRIFPLLDNGVVHWNRTTAMTPGRLPFGGAKASGNHWPAGLFMPYACVSPVASVEVAP
jgi:succinylglutamic semialdehyde dehydrogenase